MPDQNLITPVILSGGSGTRLWPLSTDDQPKQFLQLLGPLSLFQLTLQRCQQDGLFDAPIIVGGAHHAGLAEQQMDEVGAEAGTHILEPCARNTAPAIALAALACDNPQTPMLVMTRDRQCQVKMVHLVSSDTEHLVEKESRFDNMDVFESSYSAMNSRNFKPVYAFLRMVRRFLCQVGSKLSRRCPYPWILSVLI